MESFRGSNFPLPSPSFVFCCYCEVYLVLNISEAWKLFACSANFTSHDKGIFLKSSKSAYLGVVLEFLSCANLATPKVLILWC